MISKVSREEAERISDVLYRYDRVASVRSGTVDDVGEEQVKRFREQGYLIVDRVLDDEEVRQALREVESIIQGSLVGPKVQRTRPEKELQTPEEKEWATRKIYDFIDYAPALHHIAYHPGIWTVLAMLFGEPFRLAGNEGLLKPPFGGGEKPWHQDMALGFQFDRPLIGVWVSLDDAGTDNGCMHVIPGSHMSGPVPHYAVRDLQICDSSVDVGKDTVVPLKPGGVLFFHGLLHHGTPANFSSRRRRALQFHYTTSDAQLISKEEYRRIFTNDMTWAEC